MGRFLLRRLIYLVVLVAIATTVTYFLAAASLNPRANYQGRTQAVSEQVIDAHLTDLNMNDKTPMWKRYGHWVNGVLHGNLGLTIDNRSINGEFSRRVGVSLRLLLIGSILGSAAGVAAGAFGAVRQYRPSDHTLTAASFVILSIPTVVLGVFVANAGVKLNNLIGHRVVYNTGEYTPGMSQWTFSGIVDRLEHLVLPTLVLAAIAFAFYGRYQRNAMLDVLSGDFVRTAQAKGLRRARALIRHALRTALIPMGTLFAYQFALIFIGAVFTERIFSWHGMGEWFVQSIQKNDINSTAAIALFVAVLILIAGFLSDFVTAALDPRIRRS